MPAKVFRDEVNRPSQLTLKCIKKKKKAELLGERRNGGIAVR